MNKILSKRENLNLYRVVLALFTFFCFFFPQTLAFVRFALLCLLVLLSLKKSGFRVHGFGVRIFAFYLLSNFLFILHGICRGNEVYSSLKITIVWPLLFFLALQGLTDEDKDYLIRIMVYFELVLSSLHVVWLTMYILGIRVGGIMGKLQTIDYFRVNRIGFMYQYITLSQSTQVFMIAFSFTLFLFGQKAVSKKILYVSFVLTGICWLLAGRLGMWISVLCAVSFVFLLFQGVFTQKKREKKRMVISLIVVALSLAAAIYITDMRLGTFIEYALNKFEYSSMSGSGSSVRVLQKKSLIDGWKNSPIFGYGSDAFSANLGGYDWRERGYEYTYHLMLYRNGIIGLAAYIVFCGWIIYSLYDASRKKKIKMIYGASLIAGYVSALIANGSNPYMQTMGCMWMTFYPFAFVNSYQSADNSALDGTGRGKKGAADCDQFE